MKVRFIINPQAGGKRGAGRLLNTIREALRSEEGIFEIKAAVTKGSAVDLSREAVERGYEAVFVCGGDGMINEAAAPLVGTGTALGVMPMGAGNGFARGLGLPSGIRAVELLKAWKIREIDVGVICGRYFFSTAGCAFDAHLSKKYNEGKDSGWPRSMMPYSPLALLEFMRYRCGELTVKTDSSSSRVTPLLLTAANTGFYGGGAAIAPGASPDDGLIDLCIVPKAGIIRAAGLAVRLFSGRIDKYKGFVRLRVERVEVAGTMGSVIHADGEPFECPGDISIGILPKKLKVLVQ